MVQGMLFVGRVNGRWVAAPHQGGAYEVVPVEPGASFYAAAHALVGLFPTLLVVAAMLSPAA